MSDDLDRPAAVFELAAELAAIPQRAMALDRRIDELRDALRAPGGEVNARILRDALRAASDERKRLTDPRHLAELRDRLLRARQARAAAFRRIRADMAHPRRRRAAEAELQRWRAGRE